jgi:phytoene desaturase
MSQGRRVGVVGGGLGGLAAACTLAARGYDVVLFERSEWLGGKAAVLESDGYRFDMGPTILTLPGVLRRIFAEAGRNLDDELPMVPLDPQWRCFYSDGARLDLMSDPEVMAPQLDTFVPGQGAGDGYRRFIDFSARLHRISDRFFFWRSVGSLWDMLDFRSMFSLKMLRDVLGLRLGKSVAEGVRGHVAEPRVAQMLDHFTQYVGSAPDASPAVLCGIAHMQTSEGVWYPLGGTGAVPQALAKLAADLGVELRTGCGVRRILLDKDGCAAGVETDRGEQVPLAAVISNADAVRTHRELLGGSRPASRFERRRRYEPACSGVVLYLGLDRAYDHLAHHNFVFSGDPEEEFDAIYRQGMPAPDPTCYVCAPARTEPAAAPAGGEALYVLVHTPYLRPGHDWRQMLPAYRRTILDKLAHTAGLDDLESRIRFEAHLTPEDIHNRYHVLNGAIYGLACHGKYFGAFKPANRSRDVPGLYLAGGAAHPGPGMPMVLMSGWIAADALDRDGVAHPSPPTPLPQEERGERIAPGKHSQGVVTPLSPCGRGVGGEGSSSPRRSPWLLRWFTSYTRRYLSRNFHGVRLLRGTRPAELPPGPLVVVLNHPSWWDPLVCLMLTGLFPERVHSAPIEADALKRYRFFGRLGFFGVEPGTPQGALTFLRTSTELLRQPGAALWVTAQGRFADPRARPLRLKAGVGHLLRRLDSGTVLPLALEYPFWNERCPEALAGFGAPIPIEPGRSAEAWMETIETGLTAAMDTLAAAACRRQADLFEPLLGGKVGVGGVYDLWRRLKAWLCGKHFDAAHSIETPVPVGGGAR